MKVPLVPHEQVAANSCCHCDRCWYLFGPSVHSYKILRQANGPLRENQLIASDDHIWNIYCVASGALFLIRPDGYIGLIANMGRASQVKNYLRKCARK
jgi:hypothetical protein